MKFTNYRNFRDLGGYRLISGGVTLPGVFARSDLALKLTDEEKSYLSAAGFTTLIDLRTPDEAMNYKHALDGEPGFSYHNLRLDNWLRDLFYTPEESATYYHMLLRITDNARVVLTKAAEPEGGVLINCHAGKDRTGTISALILMSAGVEETEIIADYHKTLGNLLPGVPEEELRYHRLVPHAETMRIFLEMFRQRYGDIGGYFDYAGIDRSVLERIRAKLTGKTL